MEDGTTLKISICDVSNETSPYSSSKYVCDYSFVVVHKSSGQVVYEVQLLDEKGNLVPLNYKTLLNYKQIKNNANKKDLQSIND